LKSENPSEVVAGSSSKRSLIPILDLGVDLYQTGKLSKMKEEFTQLQIGTAMTLVQLDSVLDLQIAHNQMLRDVDSKLQTLSDISWKIASYFDRQEQRDEFIASMRYSIFTLNRKLDEIDAYSDDFPEHALLQTDIILELIEERDLRAEHFAVVSQDEMERAQSFLDRVQATRLRLFSLLGGSDGS